MKGGTIFGREPAFWVSTIQFLLLGLMSINYTKDLLDLSDERVALIMAVVSGLSAVFLARAMRETILAALTEVVKAVLILMTAYGLEFTTDQMNIVMGLVTIIGGAFLRTQGAPLVTPAFDNGPKAPVLTVSPTPVVVQPAP